MSNILYVSESLPTSSWSYLPRRIWHGGHENHMWIACESLGRLWKSHVNYWRHENHRWITWELWKSHVNHMRDDEYHMLVYMNHMWITWEIIEITCEYMWITWEIMEITCESHGRLGKSHVNHMVHDENHMWITWDHMWITWEHMRITCEHMGITCETHVIFICFFRKGWIILLLGFG